MNGQSNLSNACLGCKGREWVFVTIVSEHSGLKEIPTLRGRAEGRFVHNIGKEIQLPPFSVDKSV